MGISLGLTGPLVAGDRIAALTSAGTLYLPSYQKVILARLASGSIFSIRPTGTPRMRTSSPRPHP